MAGVLIHNFFTHQIMTVDVEANETRVHMSCEKFKVWPWWHYQEISRFLQYTINALWTSQRGMTGSRMKSQYHRPVFSLSRLHPVLGYRNRSRLGIFSWIYKSFFPSSVIFPIVILSNMFPSTYSLFSFVESLTLHILQFLMLCSKSLSFFLKISFSLGFLLCFEMCLPLDPPG